MTKYPQKLAAFFCYILAILRALDFADLLSSTGFDWTGSSQCYYLQFIAFI